MKSHLSSSVFLSLLLAFFSSSWGAPEDFLQCLTLYSNANKQQVYTPGTPSYTNLLQLKINNPRFNTSSTPRPSFIVAPTGESEVRSVIFCSQKHGMQMRIRCGGHDFEGLSYVADGPFVVLDLINMRSIDIDVESKTAWVQGGVSLGEFYYRISQKSRTLGFPGGVWSTVGVGGLVSGGGYGALMRKYGLAGDNVMDARVMDVNGRVLDRKSMGEDMFWAIRGGGGSSFGVILAWKLRLVDVPEIVTVCTVTRTLEQNATRLLHKWQYFAPNADRDLFMRVELASEYVGTSGRRTVRASFESVFQGRVERLIPLVRSGFPELRMVQEDCAELSWIQSALVFSGFSSQQSPQILLDRDAPARFAIKGKSDYVQKPIPISGLEGLWRFFFENDVGAENFVLNPYGGRMNDIPESATPFPHRKGNLYMILEGAYLDQARPELTDTRITWVRNLYDYMARYVSRSPRQAYVNYNDLDLGVGTKTYKEASIWGTRYFKDNFKRLVKVKAKVDPGNFFRHPQSIPPFLSTY